MLEKFEEVHLNSLKQAYLSQNCGFSPEMAYLPNIGYRYGDIAFGFLRLVEGGTAQIDGLVTNANYTGQERHEAIKQVVDAIIKHAKQLKLLGIICFTTNESVIHRAIRLKFTPQNVTLLSRNLTV